VRRRESLKFLSASAIVACTMPTSNFIRLPYYSRMRTLPDFIEQSFAEAGLRLGSAFALICFVIPRASSLSAAPRHTG
jgi:Na+/proline symporter